MREKAEEPEDTILTLESRHSKTHACETKSTPNNILTNYISLEIRKIFIQFILRFDWENGGFSPAKVFEPFYLNLLGRLLHIIQSLVFAHCKTTRIFIIHQVILILEIN